MYNDNIQVDDALAFSNIWIAAEPQNSTLWRTQKASTAKAKIDNYSP